MLKHNISGKIKGLTALDLEADDSARKVVLSIRGKNADVEISINYKDLVVFETVAEALKINKDVKLILEIG